MSDNAPDIGEGLVVGFKNLYEFVKDSSANFSVFSFAGVKRKDNKSTHGHDGDQYVTRCGVTKNSHGLSLFDAYPFTTDGNQ